LSGELFPYCRCAFVATEQHLEPVSYEEPQQSDLLVYQSFVPGEGVALSEFAESNVAAPIIWLIAGCGGRFLNFGVIFIVYPESNIPRSLVVTHYNSLLLGQHNLAIYFRRVLSDSNFERRA
jgi:hypothetical protein